MTTAIRSHRQLQVYQRAFDAASRIFEHTREFPAEERYSLTDQVRRSSRSVTAAISEAWRKRRYEAAFVSKLNDAQAEAAETQSWLEHAVQCGYLKREPARALYREYEAILKMLVHMINTSERWRRI
jgi:four helix bundle protein